MKSPSFPMLVWGIAEEHHSGALLVMALHADLPQSTLWRWVRGMPSKYSPELIRRLCEVYDLKFADVWERIQQDEAIKLAGKKIPLPDLSGVRRGPLPLDARRSKRRRSIARALAGAALLGAAVASPAIASDLGSHTTIGGETKDYVKKRRRQRAITPTRRRGRGNPHKRAA